ncbi:hypothetical protein [Dasineura jujubifolia toursvirus 2a]|nr:hypothetical protein [Dasineura jujubifolia toursvirus 2a]
MAFTNEFNDNTINDECDFIEVLDNNTLMKTDTGIVGFCGYDQEEYNEYLKSCEEYNDEVDEVYEGYSLEELLPPKFVMPKTLANSTIKKDSQDDFISLGNVPINKNTKITFRYYSRDNKIFCSSMYGSNKKQCNNKCKYAHSYKDIPFCNSKCERIQLDNNIYFGKCSKRHSKETFENFIVRKGIKTHNLKSFNIKCYERPSNTIIKTILSLTQEINIKEINIEIIPKPKTLEEFLQLNGYYDYESETE